MLNISSLLPPVNTTKLKTTKRSEIAVAGSETNKDAPHTDAVYQHKQHKRRGGDRRKRNIKPLVDLRSSPDRRKGAAKPSISIKV